MSLDNSKKNERRILERVLLEPFEALHEIRARQKNTVLQKRVRDFLEGDIPLYFSKDPIFYLARHIVTPNFETLRFIHLIRDLGPKIVISQDSRGLFVSQNLIKRALCKLPVCKRITQKGQKINEHYHRISIADFNTIDGKRFCDIKTLWGENIIDFHSRLFTELGIPRIEIPDDADWIDRHHRDNLLEHYKKLLCLFVTHGVFFENYNLDDEHEIEFIDRILKPAFDFIKNEIGSPPVISQIFPTIPESYDFWISYPPQVKNIVNKHLRQMI